MSRTIWRVVGVLLLVWVAWDLYAGYTLAWNIIYRDTNPTAYWGVVVLWAALGVSCFSPWNREKE